MTKGRVKLLVFLLAFVFFYLALHGWFTFMYFGGSDYYIAKYDHPDCSEPPRNDWLTASELREKYPELAEQIQNQPTIEQIALPSPLQKSKIKIKP